jgi:cobyrinic acid a,c-diamide synthase
MVSIPRVIIAAPASGNGKTSVATGLLAAYRASGLTVSPHKVGPDYIDPGYHTLAAGRPGRNLDAWLTGEELIEPLFLHGACTPTPADIAIIEGVMGLFDGASARGDFASTAHIARLLRAPIILVVDASGAARSVAALVHGFLTFDPTVRIGGVIFNQVGSPGHAAILREALEPMGVPVLGMVFRHESLAVPSRHLGLIPAAERAEQAEDVVRRLGAVMAESIDLDAVRRLARSAPDLTSDVRVMPPTPTGAPVRIAMAAGPAFTFGYAEHPELLAAAGAEVVMFDPTRDEELPSGVRGLVIGGGFPEVHAGDLAENVTLRDSIARLARSGAPVVAECAGLLYLARTLDGHRMCGVLDIDATMGPRLSIGYRDAVAHDDSALVAAGTRVHGHEFHRTITTPGHGDRPAWKWTASAGSVSEGFVDGGVHASYLHLHWSGVPGIAERLVAAARAHQVVAA